MEDTLEGEEERGREEEDETLERGREEDTLEGEDDYESIHPLSNAKVCKSTHFR